MSSHTTMPTSWSVICFSVSKLGQSTAAVMADAQHVLMYRWHATREPEGTGSDVSSMNAAATALGPQQHIQIFRVQALCTVGRVHTGWPYFVWHCDSFARLLASARSIDVWRWLSCPFCNGCGETHGRPVGAGISQVRTLRVAWGWAMRAYMKHLHLYAKTLF